MLVIFYIILNYLLYGFPDKLRALLALLACLTATENRPMLPLDADAAAHLANKLLRFVATIRMLAQTGSEFNRNCLRTMTNVMHTVSLQQQPSRTAGVDFFAVRNKYVRLLSGLCGHADIEVRTLAWCVLAECVRSYTGAAQLVKGQSLPLDRDCASIVFLICIEPIVV